MSSANAQTPALRFEKPLPESVARSLHDMVIEEIRREDAAARRPTGSMAAITDFLVHVIIAGTDPVIIILSLLAVGIATSVTNGRKTTFVGGVVTGCFVAIVVGALDHSDHHHDGVIMSRSVSFDLSMKMAGAFVAALGAFVAALIEVVIFLELIGLVQRTVRKTANASKGRFNE
jgi:hypothetical protein